MKKTILSILSIYFLTVLTAQKPMPKEQLAKIWSSYEKGDVTRCITERDMYVIRIHQEGADPLGMDKPENEVYSILSSPIPPHIKTADDFHKWLNLPPSSKVTHFSVMLVPKGTELWAGLIGAGDYKMTDDGKYVLKPNWLDGSHAQNGGATQFVIPPSEKSKVTSLPNFSNQPFEKIRQVYEMYPSSHNDYKPKPAEFDTHPSEDVQSVQKRYGDIPGGIIIEAKGKINTPIQSVKFDANDCSFLINGSYRYRPGLRADEIGQIANIVLFNSDKRLAAMSQTEFVNVPAQTTVARALVDADVLLGRIMYGYGLDGNGISDSLMLPTYKNPLKNSLKDLGKWWTWKAKKTETEKLSKGLEQRVFLEFNQITFQLNASSHFLEPKGIGCKVNYQAFTYNKDGTKHFSSSAELQKYYPGLVEAAKHLSANFGAYSERFPAFLKIQKMAEVYALISFIRDNNIAIENLGILEAEGKQPYIFPFMYDGFNNVTPNSDLVKYHEKALKAVEWIPNWIFFNKEDKLKRVNYKLHHALGCMDFQKIKKYRAEALSIAEALDDNKISEESRNIKIGLESLMPAYISEKINFGDRYQAQGCYKSAIAYFELMRELEPNLYTHYLQLFSLYKKMGDLVKANQMLALYKPLLEKSANRGNVLAQRYLADSYVQSSDFINAFKWYKKAADKSDIYAMNTLGDMYNGGVGVEKNKKEAFILFTKTANLGSNNGRFKLAVLYLDGFDEQVIDPQKAIFWFKKAADDNHVAAQFVLGMLYILGDRGVEKDMNIAYQYIKKAADAGDVDAQKALIQYWGNTNLEM